MKICLFILMISGSVFSQNLVYKPANPAFGGDTFNYQWLLNSADSQNLFKDPTQQDGYKPKSQLEQFRENLNNQLLNYLSRTLFQNQVGGNGTGAGGTAGGGGMEPGVYVFGSLSVELYESNLGLVVNILDVITGEETQVIIPGN